MKAAAKQGSSARSTAPKKMKGITTLACHSPETQRLALAILEVLAGVRTPTEAAAAVGLSLMRYYQLEMRALEGLISALEPRPRGKQPSTEGRIAQLEKQLRSAQREAARQQALARIAQRSLGLKAPATPATQSRSGKRRPRRPTARALKAARALRKNVAAPGPPGVQPSASAEPQGAAPRAAADLSQGGNRS